ncbi:MAG: sugar isomerase domain-containing protein [Clostridiaceae bacterium]|nr:sugar isomerase domain-containing protein [Clostridiaceae bacterium]
MLIDKYYAKVQELFDTIMDTQKENILKASSLIFNTIQKGGAVHIYDTGHIINNELIHRAGGLVLMKQLKYTFNVENPVRQRENAKAKKISQEGVGKYILAKSNVEAGDVLIIGSVSGKNDITVEMALSARSMGVSVISITSLDYSSKISSEHSSGKRLFEVSDIVIDNCAPLGDAMISVEGINTNICPASGLAAAFIMWAITADLIDKMVKAGIKPSVYRSQNLTDGDVYNKNAEESYNSTGF